MDEAPLNVEKRHQKEKRDSRRTFQIANTRLRRQDLLAKLIFKQTQTINKSKLKKNE